MPTTAGQTNVRVPKDSTQNWRSQKLSEKEAALFYNFKGTLFSEEEKTYEQKWAS